MDRAVRWGIRNLARSLQRFRDYLRPTYAFRQLAGSIGRCFSRIPGVLLEPGEGDAPSRYYLAHQFNLLGSGWVQVRHGMRCRGLEGHRYEMGAPVVPDAGGRWLMDRINRANREEARRVWGLVHKGYTPIDWHLDFKSGFRWSEQTWYLRVPIGHLPGVDIKVPWELARMHHLPQLALAHAAAASGADAVVSPRTYSAEFRNEILDFVATNPPRFGVNWRSTMDVALRIVNWLVAYDLFRAHGAEFDHEFEAIFVRSVYEHGLHVFNNLEWHRRLRTNHYLANVVGLLFVGAYLSRSPETDSWLAFAAHELVSEVGYQFNPDGTNFEASTCYHRLSAEMAIYGTALVLGLPPEKREVLSAHDRTFLPEWYVARLEKMAEFALEITKPNGQVPQIGDNDSGRLLKLQPVYRRLTVAGARAQYANLIGYRDLPDEAAYWDEDILDHRHLSAAACGLFHSDCRDAQGKRQLESQIVSVLAGGIRLSSSQARDDGSAAHRIRVGEDADWFRLLEELEKWPEDSWSGLEIPIPGKSLLEGLRLQAYPDFGLYLFRSRRLYLAVRCGTIGQRGIGGHAHNDQLSIELNVEGKDWIADPGTYVYTPLPAWRQQYRSVRAHFAPSLLGGEEPGRLDLGLFKLGNEAQARCLYFGERGFVGTHWGYGTPLYRIVELASHGLRIRDYCRGAPLLRLVLPQKGGVVAGNNGIPVSPGYGIRYAKDARL